MRRPIVAGNWKMHGSREENARLVAGLVDGIGHGGAEVIVFPPAVYVAEVVRLAAGSAVAVGGQNLCTEAVGAYTGETSGAMLRDVGASHVLVGHSERRTLYGESEATVAVKFVAAQAAGLVPVLCVGESLEEREAGVTETVVARQLDARASGLAGLQTGPGCPRPPHADVKTQPGMRSLQDSLWLRFSVVQSLYGGHAYD